MLLLSCYAPFAECSQICLFSFFFFVSKKKCGNEIKAVNINLTLRLTHLHSPTPTPPLPPPLTTCEISRFVRHATAARRTKGTRSSQSGKKTGAQCPINTRVKIKTAHTPVSFPEMFPRGRRRLLTARVKKTNLDWKPLEASVLIHSTLLPPLPPPLPTPTHQVFGFDKGKRAVNQVN